jgi:hypothetical protein
LSRRVVEVLLRQRLLLRERLGAIEVLLATTIAACCRSSAALAASTCAWNGFGSIWNITWPFLTTAPSVYTRLSSQPDTRAWMLTACTLCVCAT